MVIPGHDERGRFVKGHAPHINAGRPPNELSITVQLRAYLEQMDPKTPGQTRAQLVAQRLYELAMSDDLSVALGAVKQIQERLDGKVPDTVKVDQTMTVKGYAKVSPDDWPDAQRDR